MAIITPSANISEIRGSVGAQTFSRNHWRAYVKARTSPVQPDTASQVNMRTLLSNASQAWRDLTNEERLNWIQFANDTNTHSRLGSSHKLTGFNAFSRQHVLNALGCAEQTSFPHNSLEFPLHTAQSQNLDIANAFVQLITYDGSIYSGIQIWMSPAVSDGVMSPNSVTYRLIRSYLDTFSAYTAYIGTEWATVYGAPLDDFEGEKVFAKIKLIDPLSGNSVWYYPEPAIIYS
jgi:hypothetical protein